MKTQAIRESFLTYFQSKKHKKIASSSLIPQNDPTLLFTNAGMNQFKEIFIGKEDRPCSRAVTIQRCLRASGKHNDLEQVGYTARHHTFFEMLGNFSFGDYFKREAIHYAWEFLTHVLKLPREKLWITVFEKDDEAADIWLNEIKVSPAQFSRCDEKDNFWAMGDTGPCGPCSEIYYDHGAAIPGGFPGSGVDGDRYVEIWNLVFMQFSRDEQKRLTPLPKPSIDTGMGLERLAAVMQGVHNNYDIDIFQYLLKAIRQTLCVSEVMATSAEGKIAARVVADHIRSSAFLVADGVIPSNEGRGYVLRRIVRRAIRYGKKIAANPQELFFYQLVLPLIEVMGEAYPELISAQSRIELTLKQEEAQFEKTLQQGLKIFEDYAAKAKHKTISGEIAFKLYDTYGFPLDLTALMARERGLTVDESGFSIEMDKQRALSQSASQFHAHDQKNAATQFVSQFCGYDHVEHSSTVLAVLKDEAIVDKLKTGEAGVIILDITPFYAESGGQVGDRGMIESQDALFEVTDTKKAGSAILHLGKVIRGEFCASSHVTATIDRVYRQAVERNHSATHLLQSALRKVLGDHVVQKGSFVEADRLRFDFSHFKPMTPEELQAVEAGVNQAIRKNEMIETHQMTLDEAIKQGATALFEEKYGDSVRVVKMGEISMELCGGAHASRTGDIGLFKILSEGGIAAGVRRIEAFTGEKALKDIHEQFDLLHQLTQYFHTDKNNLLKKLISIQEQQKALEQQIVTLKKEKAKNQIHVLAKQAEKVEDVFLLIRQVDEVDGPMLREMVDQLKDHLQKAVILLASVQDHSVTLIAGVTKNCFDRFHAGELVKMAAERVGGKGGGRPDMGQGAGKSVQLLPDTLTFIKDWTKQKI